MPGSALLLALLACDDGDVERQTLPCELGDQDELSFDHDRMLCVQIEMDPEDFEELGNQYRYGDSAEDQFPGVIGHVFSSCTEPFPDPYTYFFADVAVDGLAVDGAGVRKKGFIGSVLEGSDLRPSLKVKADAFIEDQDFAGEERLTLNNNLTDRTRLRTCLSYTVFADAGEPAPLCNLANVMVNGESLGAYTHVESIKKPFLRRAFDNDDGDLYEATLADFSEAHLADGLGRWEAKTAETDDSVDTLMRVVDALAVDDDGLEAALDAVIDLDQYLRFWALETLTGHWDGHAANTNNTYVYFDPDNGDRAVFIPWGTDGAFEGEGLEGFTSSQLARRLSRHPELHDRYLAHLQDLLDSVWDEQVLHDRLDLLADHVGTAETAVSGHEESLDLVREFIDERRAQVEAFLAAGGVEGAEEPHDCNGAINLNEFADLAEVMVLFSHSCGVVPGRETGAWVWGLLVLGLRMRAAARGAEERRGE